MKAVILAGGFGTRMRPLTLSRPKPLMPIVNKPVTAHILDHLIRHGVTEVAITTNYLREQILENFGFEYRGVRITYPPEEHPLGTAGSVRNIREYFDDTFIVMQGDTITDIDLTDLIRQHNYFGGLCTVAAVKVEDPWNYGVMELGDDGRIRRFHEKPLIDECSSNLVNTGIYVIEPEALDYIPANTFFDFAKDLFPILLEKQSLFAAPSEGFWADIGKPEAYMVAKKWVMSNLKTAIADSAVVEGKLEGEVILGENVRIGPHSHLIGPIVIGDDTALERGCVIGPYTVIGRGAALGGNTLVNGAVMFEKVSLGSGGDMSNSFIAEGCRIGDEAIIQSNVMIGGNCLIEKNVSVINGSRIWPNMSIVSNSTVSGTLRRYVQTNERRADPRWSLREVTPDEAFYFNKSEGMRVSYTGSRAISLWEFNNILKRIEISSIDYHMRSDVNDFQLWLEEVICDMHLAETFRDIKIECADLDRKVLRHRILDATNHRLNELMEVVKNRGYI